MPVSAVHASSVDSTTNGATPAAPIRGEPPAQLGHDLRAAWALDPQVVFLNHGSFGARPRAVLEAQFRRREEFERQPLAWLDPERGGAARIERAKRVLCELVNAPPQGTGFVTNATGAVNAVLRSIRFKPGDELVTTNHVYNAVRQAMCHIARQAGGSYHEIAVPLPVRSPSEIVRAIEQGLAGHPRARLLVIDHITSPTAIVFPVRELVAMAHSRGIPVLVDGAHAPGMLPLDVQAIDADYYTGNLHKWLCAPPGAAFVCVKQLAIQNGGDQALNEVHPLVISHNLGQGFAAEFAWQGTMDITPWLGVEDAINFFNCFSVKHEATDQPESDPAGTGGETGGGGSGGLAVVMQHNHHMACWAQAMLCERWGVEPLSPLDGSMIGSMATVQLPNQAALRHKFPTAQALKAALYDRHHIEIPIIEWPVGLRGCEGKGNREGVHGPTWLTRLSCHIYNTPSQYEQLASAIEKISVE